MGNVFYFEWEVQMMAWLQEKMGEGLASVVSFFSAFGEEIVLILLVGFLYWCYDKKLGRKVGLNILMGLVWSPMVKNIALRIRPYIANREKIRLLRLVDSGADANDIAAQGYSFPSMHSTNAVTAYGSLAMCLKKKWMWIVAVVITLLVGFSRVYVGAHYPTDVLVGWAVGVLTIAVVALLDRLIPNRKVFYAVLVLTAIPGLFYCRSNDYFSSFGLLAGFLAGQMFEEAKVRFTETRKPLQVILRILGGGLVYFALEKLLKLPFPQEILQGTDALAMTVRTVRYAVLAFAEFGLYPMVFPLFEKLSPAGKEKEQA